MSLDFSLTKRRTVDYELASFNITHNLVDMADAAGIYDCLWRPEVCNIEKARQLTPILDKALEDLIARPAHYKQFSSPNGWGTYASFILFVSNVLEACRRYPDAKIHADR